jgi:energy-coupling factor transport system substrate-specific component
LIRAASSDLEGRKKKMEKKFGIRQVVAMGIGTALFVVLTMVQIPFPIPNTSLQPRMAILAFFSAIFGPVVGAVIGLVGHALGDAIWYGSVWWSWVFPEAIVGIAVGLTKKKLAVKEGGFTASKIVLFNVVQVVANAIAWIVVAPVLDILVYAEPANKVFIQGAFAFIGNIIIIGILGSILLAAYSKIAGKSTGLKAED